MNPKRKNIQMHKLYCLAQLLLENLDELKPTTKKMISFKSDLIGLCELLNNEVSNTYSIQKHTYFIEMSHKIDTIVRKEFNNEM